MWQYTPRVAVVRGLRTPFAKSGTHYARLSALDLGKLVVAELVQRSGIDPNSIQELVFGNFRGKPVPRMISRAMFGALTEGMTLPKTNS